MTRTTSTALSPSSALVSNFFSYSKYISSHVTVIQGTADAANNKLSQEELNKTLEFCAFAFEPVENDEDRSKAMSAMQEAVDNGTGYHPDLSPEQLKAVKHIQARRAMRTSDTMNIESFGTDAINGFVPNLVRGSLGLRKQEAMNGDVNGANGHVEETNGVNGVSVNGHHQPEGVKAH